MKHCPRCQSTYTDDTLQFCLQDGTVLVNASEAPATNPAWNQTEAPTVVRPTVTAPQSHVTQPDARQAAPKKSGTGLVIFLTALVTLLLFGVGIGAWFLLRNRGAAEVVVNNSNVNNTPKPSNKNSSNANANKGNANASPTATPQSNTNSNSSEEPPEIDAAQIKSEVSDKIYDWASALESGNLNAHMSNYAERLDYYYNSRNAAVGTVRNDKQRAFSSFDEFRLEITNMRVTPDASGEKATAVFDKEWEFEGADNRSKGKAQSQLQLTKIGGAWRITGEKDLKVYYTE
jgi:ketosteroid isomerase-like protein